MLKTSLLIYKALNWKGTEITFFPRDDQSWEQFWGLSLTKDEIEEMIAKGTPLPGTLKEDATINSKIFSLYEKFEFHCGHEMFTELWLEVITIKNAPDGNRICFTPDRHKDEIKETINKNFLAYERSEEFDPIIKLNNYGKKLRV